MATAKQRVGRALVRAGSIEGPQGHDFCLASCGLGSGHPGHPGAAPGVGGRGGEDRDVVRVRLAAQHPSRHVGQGRESNAASGAL